MPTSRVRKEAGFTFAELAFAMLVLVIGAAVLINHLAVNYSTMNAERDRVFAYAKAQAILAEIQGFVDRGGIETTVDLDVLDDGVVSKPTLTIATDEFDNLVLPDHVLSGNYQRDGDWQWSRRISVQPFAGIVNRNVRYVTVRIYRRQQDGSERALADLSAVVNSAASAFATTQVYDVYLLAVENIPGWWVYMDTIRPFVESMITDLESRNPGLAFRTHWITKAAYGRDEGYRPFVNDATDSRQPSPDVYHYPAKMPTGSSSVYYYVPDSIKGHINLDGADTNGYDADLNPHPYALADYYNHAMRYPDELALWQRRVAAIEQREQEIENAIVHATPAPEPLTDMSKEPTLRLFLEDLNTSPDKYRNALVMNLHGELLPMPALRNYSDAARVPDLPALQHMRCVTHPEELRTRRDAVSPAASDPMALRVYAYNDNALTYAGPDRIYYNPGPGEYYFTVVELEDFHLGDATNYGYLKSNTAITCVPGGVSVGGSSDYSATWQPGVHYHSTALPNDQMWWYAYNTTRADGVRCTRILLGNTPVVCPPDAYGRGLANTERARLYQMSYVPSPVEDPPSFSRDLTTIDALKPKNTARWRIVVDPAALTDGSYLGTAGTDVQLRVRTYFYTSASGYDVGVMWPPAARSRPENMSVTYSWWADSADDVPFTERAQFNGDPRHVPYKDCFNGAVDFPNAYNWYHNDMYNGSVYGADDYPGIDDARLRDRWNSALCCDVPRYMELLRRGLTKSSCIYTTLTGYSYYYLGIGNDIGYDSANGYANSIPCYLGPYGSASTGYVNNITGSRFYLRSAGAGYWWGMPWLGELYPDDAFTTWRAETLGVMRGNLDPGTAAGQFYHAAVSGTYSGGTRKAYGTQIQSHHQRTSSRGCIAFFDIGSAGSTFDHIFSSGNGTVTAAGAELASNYNLEMPATTPVSRPFKLNDNASPAEEWNFAPYTTRYTASLFQTYLSHSAGAGSGVVKLVEPSGTSAAYVTVNGIDKSVETGASFIAKWSLLTLAHTYFAAGDTGNTLRIKQQPRVEIDYPNDISEVVDPGSIDIQYDVAWTRWDGLPYTATGSFAEDENELEYVLTYSNDGGRSWRYVQDDSVAVPGERPDNPAYFLPDAGSGADTYTWVTPSAGFPGGSYHLRVDCFRQGAQVHQAYHRTQFYIQR